MKVGSLFAGIGGIDLGFHQAGFEIVWANELDKDACKTYRLNFPDTKLFECDIRKLDVSLLSKVDIITAGFPCQPFSICGNQKGFSDNRGNLFFDIMRITDAVKPQIIFLENVANLVEHDKGRTFNVIHNELVSRGYYLRYLVADACDYGIPQHRTRTYILAFRDVERCESYRFPEMVKLENEFLILLINPSRLMTVTIFLRTARNTTKWLKQSPTIIKYIVFRTMGYNPAKTVFALP